MLISKYSKAYLSLVKTNSSLKVLVIFQLFIILVLAGIIQKKELAINDLTSKLDYVSKVYAVR